MALTIEDTLKNILDICKKFGHKIEVYRRFQHVFRKALYVQCAALRLNLVLSCYLSVCSVRNSFVTIWHFECCTSEAASKKIYWAPWNTLIMLLVRFNIYVRRWRGSTWNGMETLTVKRSIPAIDQEEPESKKKLTDVELFFVLFKRAAALARNDFETPNNVPRYAGK